MSKVPRFVTKTSILVNKVFLLSFHVSDFMCMLLEQYLQGCMNSLRSFLFILS